MGVPIEVSIQLGSSWEALAGKEEPGGKEEQRTIVVMGGEELARGRHSGGVPLLKTRGVAGIVCFVRK